jgi:hypothetical protein
MGLCWYISALYAFYRIWIIDIHSENTIISIEVTICQNDYSAADNKEKKEVTTWALREERM